MRTKTQWAGLGAGLGIGSVALMLMGAQSQPPAIPDAPTPHVSLPTGGVTPGAGTTSPSETGDTTLPPDTTPEAGTTPAGAQPGATAGKTGGGTQGTAEDLKAPTIVGPGVYEVNIPFTVKDAKGQMVPNIRPAEIQVFENGRMMRIVKFVDEGEGQPLAVAIVIDQSMGKEQMDTVNAALGALQSAFSRYDEIAVFTYNKSTKQVTEFTGAQSMRASQSIDDAKGPGRDEMLAGSLGGPLAHNLVLNDQNFDPNTSANRGHSSLTINPPRESHPLYDAILTAATALSTQPVERRRVVYVISNGQEYGSKTKGKDLLHYLQTNGIEVDGTLIGIQTALPVVGMLDRIHLPLQMRDNVLTPLANATGGNVDAEFRASAIERGFAKVVGETRNRYIVTWDSPEPFYDGKSRSLNITVLRPGLTVIAPPLYYPEAMELRQRPASGLGAPKGPNGTPLK
ncbi:MAG TPA: VWA domain-containing protein [Acidobacteriaceae bacterium]|nr:VWA domain-containing protein [Acidobacteriaceae bacterium]